MATGSHRADPSNSLKYTNQGGLEIYMEGQELCIKDTGIGIKKQRCAPSL